MNSHINIKHYTIAVCLILVCLVSHPATAQTYTNLYGPPQARNVNDITSDLNGVTLYTCDKSVLFKSTNSAGSWAATASEKASPLVVVSKTTVPTTVVVGVTDQLYQSTDGGSSWGLKLNVSGMTPLRLAVSPLNADQMYLGRQASGSSTSIYRSTDAGASWSQPNTYPSGTNINDIAPHPSGGSQNEVWSAGADPNGAAEGTVMASRGVWKSTNLGADWTKVIKQSGTEDMEWYNLKSIAIRSAGTIIFVGTNASGKVFSSNNGGSSWATTTSLGGSVTSIRALRIRSGSEVWAATNAGIFKSTNNGGSWTNKMSTGDNNILAFAIAPNSTNIMYATTANTVWKTINGATTWTEVTTGLGRMPLSSVASSSSNVWTVSKDFTYASKYDGTQWTRVALGAGQIFSGERIILHPNGNLFTSGAVSTIASLYKSTDNGSNYTLVFQPSSTSGTNFKGTVVDPINSNRVYIFGAYTDGSQRNWDYSNDATASWTRSRPLISGTYTTVQDMVVDPSSQFSGVSQNILVAMNSKGIYRSTDAGATWAQVAWSSTSNVQSLALNTAKPQNVYAASNGGGWGVYKSDNYGATPVSWSQIRGGAHKKVAMCPGVGSANTYIAAIPNDGSALWYSPDAGFTWLNVTGNLLTPINNVFGEGSTTGTMYVATDKGTYKITEPSQPSSLTVTNGSRFDVSLSWSPPVSGTAVAAYHLEIAYDLGFTNLLTDNKSLTGTSYSPLNLINNTTYYWRVAANNVAGESEPVTGSSFTISASQTMTLTISFDGNNHPVLSWTSDPTSSALYKICRYSCVYPGGDCNPHPESSPYTVLTSVSASPFTDLGVTRDIQNPNTEYFYEIRRANYSDKKSVLSHPIQKTTPKSDLAEDLPRETKLELNYPNPFNPITEIKYSLKEETHVLLQVYDILGREVKTLVNKFQSAGFKSIQFDARSLPSGVYFYKLTAGSYTDLKKMLLAK